MELNKMRGDYIAEVKRKDILNMKKKILKEPIEIGKVKDFKGNSSARTNNLIFEFPDRLTEIKNSLNGSPNCSPN